MGLEDLRDDIVIKQRKGIPFIGASVIIWLLITIVVSLHLPIFTTNILIFCCSCPLLPIAWVIGKKLHIDIFDKSNPLGRIPRLNEDLLDVSGNYILTGNMFWIAIDDNDRVIGSIGTKIISTNEMWLKRLFVKSSMKRQGIGKKLYKKAEEFAVQKALTRYIPDSRLIT